MANTPPSTALVVPHTHWDREWRYPLWRTRALLVAFMDTLLEILEQDPDYACFVLDGQSVVIEDYLEIRPDREALVRQRIAEGRLAVGPWYTLPDLYPVDGECLVRNLLKGTRLAASYGKCLSIGYTSFGWGQTAQFPQIYAGFGMEFIVTAKRVSEERAPTCEFLWEAPDGTRILTTRLGEHARANVFMNSYLPARYGREYLSDDFRLRWEQDGTLYHDARAGADVDYFMIAGPDAYYADRVPAAMRKAWDAMRETTVPEFRVLMNGSDFSTPQPILTRMLADANAAMPEIDFRIGTLEEYAAEMLQRVDRDALPVVQGEMRDGPASSASANALATRLRLKQVNKQAQNVLLRRAEPLAAALALRGRAYPESYLQIAWKYLLLSHPHDSINSVTQDKTAHDTLHRLEQAIEIGQVVAEEATAHLIAQLDLSGYAANDQLLLVMNPRPYPVREVVHVHVDTPQEAAVWNFTVTGPAGEPLAVQHLGRQEVTVPVHDLESRPWPFYVDRHTAYVETGEIPAGGYAVLRIVPEQHFNRNAAFWPAMRVKSEPEISPAANVLENAALRVVVMPNGTLTLTDKFTGRHFTDLLSYEDTGDVGDYWVHYPPYHNRTYTSLGSPASIWVAENGPLAATLGVRITLEVPACGMRPEHAIRGESRRSDAMTPLTITSYLTLKRDATQLEVRTQVENTARDHRFRVLLPTDLPVTHSDAAGHFTVDHRPVAQAGMGETFWPEMQTLPQQTFVDVSDGAHGLGIVNDSLTEYEVLDDGRGTLALTLFRSVRNIICTEFRSAGVFPQQDGGQSLGMQECHFAIVPHAGTWQDAQLYREADVLNAPLSVYQITPHSRGAWPTHGSLYAIEPEALVLSAFKKAEDRDSYILRIFNPTGETVQGHIIVQAPINAAYLTKLNEERQQETPVEDGNRVPLTVAPHKIVTVEVVA